MFFSVIPKAYRIVLIVSAFILIGSALMGIPFFLNLFTMLKGTSWLLMMNTLAKSACVILLSLIAGVFLIKKAKQIKNQINITTLALFAQVLSVIGLLLAVPWLWHRISATYSWSVHMMGGFGVSFDYWAYLVATGIVLYEVVQMPANIEMQNSSRSDEPEIQRPDCVPIESEKDLLL